MALNTEALCEPSELRLYLTRDRTDETDGVLDDAFLEDLINRVTSRIAAYCDRQLLVNASDHTVTLDGDGTDAIRLYRVGCYPIVSVTSVTFLASSTTVAARSSYTGTGYVLTDEDKMGGRIRLAGYVTDVGMGLVQVVGKWGYSETVAGGTDAWLARQHRRGLDELKLACLEWSAALFHNHIPGQQAITIAGVSMTLNERAIPQRVERLLASYRRPFA